MDPELCRAIKARFSRTVFRMTPDTLGLFRAVVSADASAVAQALARGADVNATDELGRNVLSYAALGPAIDSIATADQPRLSEEGLHVLRIVCQHPGLTLYSINAPMAWAGGVTLLGLMSWLNMPSEIMCLFESTEGLSDANAMDEQGATPLMYAVRDGHLQVSQRLLSHGARPDFHDITQHSSIYYALPHPQILWLCEETLRRMRKLATIGPDLHVPRRRKIRPNTPFPRDKDNLDDLFFRPHDIFLTPPSATLFSESKNVWKALVHAIRKDDPDIVRALLAASCTRYPKQTTAAGPFAGIPVLVNMRDDAGLTLVHHAVARKPFPNPAILDALYNAGADVGLHSALGFTPLHHLAQKARDDDPNIDNTSTPDASLLYRVTVHLIRDLHAPLSATDSRGETPFHAAAEHGRSVAVLRAMLDCHREFYGKGSAGEARNDRGLRASDVAKPQYLHLFGVVDLKEGPESRAPSPVRLGTAAFLPSSKVRGMSAYNWPKFANLSHAAVHLLEKRLSNASLLSNSCCSSRSSGQSSSSGRSFVGSASPFSRNGTSSSRVFRTRHVSTGTSPAVVLDTDSVIDISACTSDILYNLNYCASGLHAYTQPHANTDSLPDLPALSDTLHCSRELAALVFDHWMARLETASRSFRTASQEYEKALGLLRRGVGGKDGGEHSVPAPASVVSASSSVPASGRPGLIRRERFVSMDETSRPSSNMVAVDARERVGLAPDGRRPKVQFHIHTWRKSTVTFDELNRREDDASSSSNAVKGAAVAAAAAAPALVLERARRDLEQVKDILASVEARLRRSRQLILHARDLVQDEIQARDETLQAVYDGGGSDHAKIRAPGLGWHASLGASSLSLKPRHPENDPENDGDDDDESSARMISKPDEPEALRQLLTCTLQESVDCTVDQIRQAHVWSRVVRGAVRGQHRRLRIALSS